MRRKYYLTLDTETATLPFANQIAQSAKEKQTIAISKPLVYDIGWVITDRQGNVVKTENFLVQETFFVPNVFNTAYYRDKRPIYMAMYENGQLQAKTWNEIMELLLLDLHATDIATAYNACFDFKKAIPFTEKYIKHLYSADYTHWEDKQRRKCVELIRKRKNTSGNPDYLKPYLELRGEKFPIADLWGIACDRLINIDKYRNYCLENGLLTASAQYFKSSAETSFQYLMKNYNFVEDHTALSDALIEAEILTKALKKGKVEPYIKEFPFRKLGTTKQYVYEKQPKYAQVLIDAIDQYIRDNCGDDLAKLGNKWWVRICNDFEKICTDFCVGGSD